MHGPVASRMDAAPRLQSQCDTAVASTSGRACGLQRPCRRAQGGSRHGALQADAQQRRTEPWGACDGLPSSSAQGPLACAQRGTRRGPLDGERWTCHVGSAAALGSARGAFAAGQALRVEQGSTRRARWHRAAAVLPAATFSRFFSPSVPASEPAAEAEAELEAAEQGDAAAADVRPVAMPAELVPAELVLSPRQYKRRIPIYVMLPLNTVTREGTLQNVKALSVGFQALKQIGVDGVMVDVWWGVVERIGPKEYDWAAYKQLLAMVKAAGLKLQTNMSFHACGANVGDVYEIPLPSWVLEAALQDPDMLFTDQHGYRNPECLSLFADNAATVASRTPLQCYSDFMHSFVENFKDDIGTSLVEVSVGAGPCGELRYPAYPENKRCPKASQWRFPGIGEFQCYDKRALLSLAKAASEAGHIEWGGWGPHDAGGYNDLPHETGFFKSHNGSWDTSYGQFFLSWYSGELIAHGDRVLKIATEVFANTGAQLSLKCAGVHWWYNSRSHAAELTAGYYNTRMGDRVPERNGYAPIVALCAQYGVNLNFTCVEMRDVEHPWEARCGPEGLLRQVRSAASVYQVPVVGENALCRFDREAYERIIQNCIGDATWDSQERMQMPANGLPPMAGFTFLRMSPSLFDERNFPSFVTFVRKIREATGCKPEAEPFAAEPAVLPDPTEFTENCETTVCTYRL